MTRRAIWLPLGLIAALALGLTGFLASPADAQAPDATVSVSSATIAPGGATTCPFNPPVPPPVVPDPVEATCIVLSVAPAVGVSVGTIGLTLAYDGALLDVTGPFCDSDGDTVIDTDNECAVQGLGVCNSTINPINCQTVSLTAMFGTFVALEFTSIAGVGVVPLDLTVTLCSTPAGGPLNCVATDGTITIQAPTPTPTPTPVTATPTPTPVGQTPSPTPIGQTASPSPTPAGLPPTGGDSSSSALPLFLAAMGVVVVTAGAWAVTRLRRVQA